MAVITSGTIGLSGQINAVFGRGTSSVNYRGTTWFKYANPMAPPYQYYSNGTFASTNLSLEQFYGTAPTDEWTPADCACDCVCACACGK